MNKMILGCLAALAMSTSTQGALISELYGNQPGADPSTQDIELSGTPLAPFDLWLVSLESDTGSSEGVVDRASNVSGVFDSNGLTVVSVPDLENPSFTLILADGFTGLVGDDLDADDDGIIDSFASFSGIQDAVGVIEDSGDPNFADDFGGTYLAPFASTDPDLVFRAGSTGEWYYTNTFNGVVYDENGAVFSGAFTSDPLVTTFGLFNPVVVVPEPSSLLSLAVFGIAGAWGRRRRS